MGRWCHIDPHARLACRTRHGILLFPISNPRTVGVQDLFALPVPPPVWPLMQRNRRLAEGHGVCQSLPCTILPVRRGNWRGAVEEFEPVALVGLVPLDARRGQREVMV